MKVTKCDNCGALGAVSANFDFRPKESFPAFVYEIRLKHITYDEHLCHSNITYADLCYKCRELFKFDITGPGRK